MAKWIAVKKKEYEHACRTVEQIEYPFRHVIEEVEAKCQKYKSYLEAIHSTVMIGGGIECQNALIQVLIAQKSDATKWRAFNQSSAHQRVASLEDAELGALVRRMPQEFNLRHLGTGGWGVERSRVTSLGFHNHETPEAALRAALKDAE